MVGVSPAFFPKFCSLWSRLRTLPSHSRGHQGVRVQVSFWVLVLSPHLHFTDEETEAEKGLVWHLSH